MVAPPTTTKIMIIRHAEKPPDSGEPFGVTAKGNQDVESLIIQGWQRAGALACFFAPTHGPLQDAELATPQFLFASESKSGGSERPVETITPLASKLGLTPVTHKKSDINKVAADAMACGGTALIWLAARGHPFHRQRHREEPNHGPPGLAGRSLRRRLGLRPRYISQLLFLQPGPAALAGRRLSQSDLGLLRSP